MMSNTRLAELQLWVADKFNAAVELLAITNDASFRKYYRFSVDGMCYLAVDSPPAQENNLAYILVNKLLSDYGVMVPKIFFQDLDNGFLVVQDFGDDVLLPKLKKSTHPEKLYDLCLDQLLKIQACNQQAISSNNYQLPHFDAMMLNREMELFREWFVAKYLKITLSPNEHELLDRTFKLLTVNAESQPQGLVHRDFHSRNLICVPSDQMGVIDFQDAVCGPVTYDLVSLFRDCYINWPLDTIKNWVTEYFEKSKIHGIIDQSVKFSEYWLWFLQMSLQRNFKTIGIFARLFLRDNKLVYLGDIPRTLNYVVETTAELEKLHNLGIYKEIHLFVQNSIVPALEETRSHSTTNDKAIL